MDGWSELTTRWGSQRAPRHHAPGRRRSRAGGAGISSLFGSCARTRSTAALLLMLYLVGTSGPARQACATVSKQSRSGLQVEELAELAAGKAGAGKAAGPGQAEGEGEAEAGGRANADPNANPDPARFLGENTEQSPSAAAAAAAAALLGRRHHRHHTSTLPKDSKIKHVVVLVMENRSFDHLLGFLKRRNPEIDGLDGTESNPMNVSDPDSPRVFVADHAEYVDPDPGHSYQSIREQVFGVPRNVTTWHRPTDEGPPPPMNGFAQNAEALYPNTGFPQRVMSGFRPEAVPAYTALAEEFVVFDHWFASVPGSTEPNRFYVHSATSHGAMSNVREELALGFPQKPIFESLDESGLTFGVYFNNAPTTLFFRSLRSPRFATKFHTFWKFKTDARLGKLPNYVVIEPRYFDLYGFPANDDHPSHDLSRGQMFVKEVYETLRSSPAWKETLLIITYDEHGGFYDHVPTPVKGVPNPDGLIGPPPYEFDFTRLGVRVPTIMVSPWLNKGKVYHRANGPTPTSEYEHSSIPATVRKLFNLKDGPLTKREAWAGTFEHILAERDTPRDDCPKELPEITRLLRSTPANENVKVTEFQQKIVEMAALLTGDEATADIADQLTVRKANDYIEKQVHDFLVGNLKLRAKMLTNASSFSSILNATVTVQPTDGGYDNGSKDDMLAMIGEWKGDGKTEYPAWWLSFETLSSTVEGLELAASQLEAMQSFPSASSSSSWISSLFGWALERLGGRGGATGSVGPVTQSWPSTTALQVGFQERTTEWATATTTTTTLSSITSTMRNIFGRRWGPEMIKDAEEL
ncbi:hypothetical protein CBR_g1116 [Chara braunii]|uniref:Phospholipase C n=1 Tax=Chara braunii TaxID=69332 RepID=A0A388KDA0_CHABU|nr:hypothetical protein CBR_g1116 [Chara braunii]|eukprot:GBG67997.1 hypothetical protein CBR_g1116 [Chara braunii]